MPRNNAAIVALLIALVVSALSQNEHAHLSTAVHRAPRVSRTQLMHNCSFLEKWTSSDKWKRFMGTFISPTHFRRFFELIEPHFPRTDSDLFKMNKTIVWLHSVCNDVDWSHLCYVYGDFSERTARRYVDQVGDIILVTFMDSHVISMPSEANRNLIEQILVEKGERLPASIFIGDDSHRPAKGRKHKERRSWKWKFRAAYGFTFVVERATRTICAVNLAHPVNQNDITAFRNLPAYRQLPIVCRDHPMVLDTGYVGLDADYACVIPRQNMTMHYAYPAGFWKCLSQVRVVGENVFATFFVDVFTGLGRPRRQGENLSKWWEVQMTGAVVLYNLIQWWRAGEIEMADEQG